MRGARQLLTELRAAGAIFQLVDDRIKVQGPSEIIGNTVLAQLRQCRPALRLLLFLEEEATPGVRPIAGRVSALEAKRALRWDAFRFTRFCHRVIGRPGPSTIKEDEVVLDAMLADVETGAVV